MWKIRTSISDPDFIDVLGVERETGVVVLTLADPLDWANEDDHLQRLREKLDRYLAFVERGGVAEVFPEVGDGRVVIAILAAHDPTSRAIEFYERVTAVIAEAGLELRFATVAGGTS